MSRVKVPLDGERIKQLLGQGEQFGIPVDTPDLAFLRKLSIAGRLRFLQGTGGTPITITPNVGETFFVYRIIYTGGSATTTFTFLNDGNTREILRLLTNTTAPSGIQMDSLVGNGTKQITITTNAVAADVSLYGWVENTSRIRDVTI